VVIKQAVGMVGEVSAGADAPLKIYAKYYIYNQRDQRLSNHVIYEEVEGFTVQLKVSIH
jgi:hypothetical protein